MKIERFVVCIKNDGANDLDVRKLCRVVPDEQAWSRDYLRVVDESGEDYLYPAGFFAEVDVPEATARALTTR